MSIYKKKTLELKYHQQMQQCVYNAHAIKIVWRRKHPSLQKDVKKMVVFSSAVYKGIVFYKQVLNRFSVVICYAFKMQCACDCHFIVNALSL